MYNQGKVEGACDLYGATDGPEFASENVGECPIRKEQQVEERLKTLMQDLGNAINESLSDSERIAEAIGEIKQMMVKRKT